MPSTAKRVHVWFFEDRWFWDFPPRAFASESFSPGTSRSLDTLLEDLHDAYQISGFLIAFGPPSHYRHGLRYCNSGN